MREMQFSAVLLTALMSVALMFLMPRKVKEDKVLQLSRTVMTMGLVLLCIQFLLQYTLGLRSTSPIQAVALNLMLFMPTSALMSISVLNLQRQGNLNLCDRLILLPTWVIAMLIIGITALTGGKPFMHDSPNLLWAEIMASALYTLMQIYYTARIAHQFKRMRQMLADFYDHEMYGLLNWMLISVIALTLVALTAPMVIFSSGWPLAAYGVLVLGTIFYHWFCFCRYVQTSAASHIKEAEESESETESEEAKVKSIKLDRLDKVVEKWVAQGGYLHHDIKIADVAKDLKIPRSHLLAWVKASGYESFTRWITTLRIEEAKRLLAEHPDYSIEYVADHCGISRTHFHSVFKKETGVSPTRYSK